jgi:hypothetical protein
MQGIVQEDSEMSFRRKFEHGAIETFQSVQRVFDPGTREVLRAWIENDVYVWRTNSVLSYPPIWRLGMLAGPRQARGAAFPHSSSPRCKRWRH